MKNNTLKLTLSAAASCLFLANSASAVITLKTDNNTDDPLAGATFTWDGTAMNTSNFETNFNDFNAEGTPSGAIAGDNFRVTVQPFNNWVPGAAGTGADAATYNAFASGGFDATNVEIDRAANGFGVNINADDSEPDTDSDDNRVSTIGEGFLVSI